MKNKLLLLLTFSSILTACGNTDEKKVQDKVIEDIQSSQSAPLKKIENSKSTMKKNDIKIGRSVYLNNQKFKLLSAEVIKGAEVYNLSIKEMGRIKGTIVIVTKQLSSSMVANKIALDTYRLTPKKGQTLSALYKELIADENNKTVELEIDYSPISKAPSM